MDNYNLAQMWRDIYFYLRPYRRQFWFAALCRTLSDISNLYPAYVYSQLITLLTTIDGQNTWNQAVFLIITWIIANLLFRGFHDLAKFFGYRSGQYAGLDAKNHALKHMYRLDLNWHELENSGNKIKLIDNANRAIRQTVEDIFRTMMEAVVNVIGVTVLFWNADSRISITMIFYVITYAFLSHYLSKQVSSSYKPISTEEEVYEGLGFESINNIRTLKMLTLYKRISHRIDHSLNRLKRFINKHIFENRKRNLILDLYTRFFDFAIMAYIIWRITQGLEGFALLILFRALVWKVIDATFEFSEVYNVLMINRVYMKRFHDLMATKPTIEKQLGQKDFPQDWQEIKLRDLSFAYAEKTVLKDLYLTISRGEKIGIVGISGAGKSTFVKLILDLYEDYSGGISYDELSLKEIKREDYIRYVATVSQDTELFNDTLENNIIIGAKSDVSPEKVEQACEVANLEDVIAKLPLGLKTVIGEKGFKLSGGERQRVGIARAVIRDPQIIVLDEATSHLDSASEKKIQAALSELFNGVTAIVIAHRLSTLSKMDRIIVLENGVVVEQGKMQELIDHGGKFAGFWKKQNQLS